MNSIVTVRGIKMVDVAVKDTLYGFETRDVDKRRALPGERKTYEIKQLWQRNHEILRMALIGMKAPHIADVLGIHPKTVSNTINSELGRNKLSLMRQERDDSIVDVAKDVAKMYPECMKVYNDILNGDCKSKLMKETADTLIMDIGGNRAPQKIQSETLHLTPTDIEEFKKRGLAAAKASGMVVDVEPEIRREENV